MSFEDLLNEAEQKNVTEIQRQENKELALEKKRDSSMDLNKFNEVELERVKDLKREITMEETNSIGNFGMEIQGNIAKFADGILEGVKTKDTGHIGSDLTSLLTTIKQIDIEKFQEKKSIMSNIPFFGKLRNSIEKAKIQVENVTQTVDKIVISLDTARKELIRDVNVLDILYEKNMEYLHQLELYIAAGELKYKELKDNTLVNLKEQAQKTQDMLDIQRYNDFVQLLSEVEKRIHDLKLSREISIQTLPQIRLMQSNDKILASKIQASILTTIPIWKNQIALAISLNKQKSALEIQKKVSDTTENMLKQNAELLKVNTIEIAKESERGVISIETLKETHQKLLETIEGSMKIYEEGKMKRANIEKELTELENIQKQKLLEYKSQYK
ncbi:toxic anion resistance protein [Inediibacterium massiliense]|uniref:toxic anion resistance protein n=1 Tax=Inediibacterium massiliense TaxID=1658111 RepID=UPI0006B5A48B|nr:toxic anion resistance protein [Inediibacterium massiliense]